MKLRRDMHPSGGYFVSVPREKAKLLDWCEGDVLSVDVVKDRLVVTKVSSREHRQAQTGEVIEDLDHPRKVPDVPKQVALSNAPAETGIPATEKSTEESTEKTATRYAMSLVEQQKRLEEVVKTAPAPATKERPGAPGTLSGEGHRTCPACDVQVAEHAGRCHRCGADLVALEKQMNIWRQMHKDPIGR